MGAAAGGVRHGSWDDIVRAQLRMIRFHIITVFLIENSNIHQLSI
jgi:hypothetical protein